MKAVNDELAKLGYAARLARARGYFLCGRERGSGIANSVFGFAAQPRAQSEWRKATWELNTKESLLVV